MLNLSKAVIFTAIVMTGFLQDMSIGEQSLMQKVQSSVVTQTIQPISTEEAKIMALAIVKETSATKSIKPEIVVTSYYGGNNDDFNGKEMANREIFDESDPKIAAHKSLPFGTKVTLESPINNEKLVVTIKDRGPYVDGRQLDVSEAAAEKLGLIEDGVAPLLVTKIVLPENSKLSESEAYAML